jgi:AcrR family transcriptional regulator
LDERNPETAADGAETADRAAAASPTERILGAAEQWFRRCGYGEVAIRQIAESAGVSKSLVLYHYRSKEALYIAVQLRIYERLAENVRAAARAHGGSAAERTLTGLDALLDALRGGNDLAAHALLGAHALADRSLEQDVRRMRSDLNRLMHDTIAELLGDEELLPMSFETMADVLSATLAGIGLKAALGEPPDRVERAFQGLRALVATALASNRPGPTGGA